MAKRKPTIIAGMTFKTQNDGKDYVRNILFELEEVGEVNPEDEHWDFFQDLIKGHHEWEIKNGPGIQKFLI